MNGDYYKDRDTKITFLTKIIQLAEMMGGITIEAKPQKIVAGLESEVSFYNNQGNQSHVTRHIQSRNKWSEL